LPLLVLGVLADHANYTLAPDDFALRTTTLNRCTDFHCKPPNPIALPLALMIWQKPIVVY